MALEHIFFDLDRTLWDFDRNSRYTLQVLFEKHIPGLEGGFGVFLKSYEHINEQLWEKFRKGHINREDLRYVRFHEALKSCGMKKPPRSLVEQLGDEYLVLCPVQPHCLPGAVETLSELGQYFQLHIITNGFRQTQHTKLKHSGLSEFFNQVITSEDAGARKPDPAIFSYAFSKTGAHAGNSIMVGDDHSADIQGAINAGMPAIHLSQEIALAYADVRVAYSLAEVKGMLMNDLK